MLTSLDATNLGTHLLKYRGYNYILYIDSGAEKKEVTYVEKRKRRGKLKEKRRNSGFAPPVSTSKARKNKKNERMSLSELKKLVRDFRLVGQRDRSKLTSGVGQPQFTMTIRTTNKRLAGYELDSMDGRIGMVTCELVSLESKSSRRGLPHQVSMALRGLRRGLSAEKRAQCFFGALIRLKGCRIVELPPKPQQQQQPQQQPKPQKSVALQEPEEPEEPGKPEVKMPEDDEVPSDWDDSDDEEFEDYIGDSSSGDESEAPAKEKSRK